MGKIDVIALIREFGTSYLAEGQHRTISTVAPIDVASQDQLSFCSQSGERAIRMIQESRAGIILCKAELFSKVHPNRSQLFIFVDNPRLLFIRLLKIFTKDNFKRKEVSPYATVSKKAKIGKDCSIGEFAIIGENCRIGDNVIIEPHVSLVQNCLVGNNCIIQSGAVIGADGFAFERHKNGDLERFPHIGNVVIGDDVEICANSSIARGSLADTIIGSGSKIDALVHVAHNVVVGKNCELTAGTIVGGSTTIGDCSWMGLNCTLKNKIKVGSNVIVASGASVISDVQDFDVVAGVPARSIKHKVHTDELFLMAGQKFNKVPAA